MAKKIKTVAVFSSGGDAPGMNAAIRAVVRTGIYHGLNMYGIIGGYEGMIKGKFKKMDKRGVGNILHRGGTVLKTARSLEFMTKEGRAIAYKMLKKKKIDACIAIGGNGTFTGAKVFTKEYNIPFIGIPGTIDNDLYGTDYTIGFDTALNTAMEAIDRIRDTADSHNRVFFVEVMGRHSGFLALDTGIGTGAGGIVIPEKETQIEDLIQLLKRNATRKKLFSVIIVSEGNKMGGAPEIAAIINKRFTNFDTRVTVIGHLQRGGSPSCMDRVLASRLGYEAINALLDNKLNIMVGIVNNKVNYTSFKKAINKSKPIDLQLLEMAEILAM